MLCPQLLSIQDLGGLLRKGAAFLYHLAAEIFHVPLIQVWGTPDLEGAMAKGIIGRRRISIAGQTAEREISFLAKSLEGGLSYLNLAFPILLNFLN